jgi:hypothetical protein
MLILDRKWRFDQAVRKYTIRVQRAITQSWLARAHACTGREQIVTSHLIS